MNPLSPVDLTIDSREAIIKVRKGVTVKSYLESLGLRCRVEKLPVGDYHLHARSRHEAVLIERKTVTDFANAIRSGRLWSQLEPLAVASQEMQVILVLEGWIKLLEKFTKWTPQAIMRIIEIVQTKYRIPIIYSPSFDWTARYIKAKAVSLGKPEEKRVYPLRHGKKPMSIQERILYVAEGLVGPTLARRLLAKFKTLRAIANAQRAELMSVEGIGRERAELIYAIFNTPYEE